MNNTSTTDAITMADGCAARQGDLVFNYYDRYPVTIGRIDTDGWFDTILSDDRRGPSLNPERVCSIATAMEKGWT